MKDFNLEQVIVDNPKLKNFEKFMKVFREIYDPNDYKVLKLFLPTAKECVKLTKQDFGIFPFERIKLMDMLKSDLPLDIKMILASPLKTFSMTKKLTRFVGGKCLPPKLPELLDEMDGQKRISTNKRENAVDLEVDLDTNAVKKTRVKVRSGSCYDQDAHKINIDMKWNAEDSLSLLHELAHTRTRGLQGDSLLCEIPSVLTEILTDNWARRFGIDYGDIRCGYFETMLEFAPEVVRLCELFGYYERYGQLTNDILRATMRIKKPVHAFHINEIKERLTTSTYFVGIATAFALEDEITDAVDLDALYDKIGTKETTDTEKLRDLNITRDKLSNVIPNRPFREISVDSGLSRAIIYV